MANDSLAGIAQALVARAFDHRLGPGRQQRLDVIYDGNRSQLGTWKRKYRAYLDRRILVQTLDDETSYCSETDDSYLQRAFPKSTKMLKEVDVDYMVNMMPSFARPRRRDRTPCVREAASRSEQALPRSWSGDNSRVNSNRDG
jgi:hypothetical protein